MPRSRGALRHAPVEPTREVAPTAALPGRAPRRPFLDNTKLLVLGVAGLIAVLTGLLALANRSAALAPDDILADAVLYALTATNLTMLVALVFVLARNIVKIVVERRRALPFARFRAKLVAVLLGLTLIPCLLVLLVGSELILNSVDRWFNAPMEEVLSSANGIAADYYADQQRLASNLADRLARALGTASLASTEAESVRRVVLPDLAQGRVELVEVYRVERDADGRTRAERVVHAASPDLPSTYEPSSADSLARRVAQGGTELREVERLADGGELARAAYPVRAAPGRTVRGVVIASEYLTSEFAARARRMTAAYEGYQQLRVLKQPLAGVYLSFFVMLTLMILIGATWMGFYMAKRITRPVQMIAAAADEIGAGHLDHRVQAESRDEFGSLVEAFNRMAGELAVSRRRLERSAVELQRKHEDVEGRRRYVETVLERIATGVVSIDAEGRIGTWNAAATRLLGVGEGVSGRPAKDVFGTPGFRPLGALLDEAGADRHDPQAAEVVLSRDGREVHLSAVASGLRREDGRPDGVVLVFDDISPLIRAQKVAAWREVARRLAHEIKNPLTPIQLCAERLRRHFGGAPEATRALVDECTGTIVGEVESLKGLVDEFSQFARMPAPRTAPTDLHTVLEDALALYRGLLPDVEFRREYAAALPLVSVDPEQIRRAVLNLVDNAVDAMERRGVIEVGTELDRPNNVVRLVVADDGPGIPREDRDRLFLPYYSTKQRGSGLGLAIVRRIAVEHGGSIEVSNRTPRGTRFTIELPVA
jgi:two-component system nitrogen regulation sensor histidine kinase NtrY